MQVVGQVLRCATYLPQLQAFSTRGVEHMSQFITTSGAYVDFGLMTPFKLVPIAEAGSHLSKLADKLEVLDGSPVYFVDDGATGTSDDVLDLAEDQMIEQGDFDGTPLDEVITLLHRKGNAIRIWWGGESNAHLDVVEFETLKDLKQALVIQHPIFRARISGCPC